MRKRRNADAVARVLREADRDLAKGLTVGDVWRKLGIAQNSSYRWGRRNQPKQRDAQRRCRCAALPNWLEGVGAEPIPVAAGSPWENGDIEAFHSRLRDELLERTEFESVLEARAKGSWYRRSTTRYVHIVGWDMRRRRSSARRVTSRAGRRAHTCGLSKLMEFDLSMGRRRA
jgi:transposase InsO family protein